VNLERYRQLLDQLLDDELSPADAKELSAILRAHPELRKEVRTQLALWDGWAQRVAPERAGEAFVESWKTRADAEEELGAFTPPVRPREFFPLATALLQVPFWKRWLRPLPIAIGVCAVSFLAMGSWWAQQYLAQPRTSPDALAVLATGNNQIVTVAGEGVCVSCVLQESKRPGPALRLKKGEITKIVYVRFNGFTANFHDYFSGGKTVRATGVLNENRGRLVLTAQTLEVDGKVLRAKPEVKPQI
jgi:hypothetical protein